MAYRFSFRSFSAGKAANQVWASASVISVRRPTLTARKRPLEISAYAFVRPMAYRAQNS